MGIQLSAAVTALRSRFPAQRQGDCGVFSFYYAAHLIQHMHGASGLTVLSVDPPRKRYHPVLPEAATGPDRVAFNNPWLTPQDRQTLTASIRKFAKVDFQSVQGEIFSLAEMQSLIDHYGYGSSVSIAPDAESKKIFISEALRKDHPVLIPYWCDDDGFPCATDREPGGHWSVIFEDGAGDAQYLNPWFPAKSMKATTDMFMASNAAVDDMPYAPHWVKGAPQRSTGGVVDKGSKTMGGTYGAATTVPEKPDLKIYKPMYPGARKQVLKHVLFEVYASTEQLKSMAAKPLESSAK